jgi:hypothetical protein
MPLKRHTETAALRQVEIRDYPRDLAGLLEQLGDADPAVRRWAARDLVEHPDGGPALCERLSREGDASVRAALFSSATRIGGAAVVPAMIELLRSEDPGLRNGAIEALASLPDAVAPQIECLLQDSDSDVRIFTINLLGELRHPQLLGWLTGVLEHEPEVKVVGAALEVLAEVGQPESLPALRLARQRFADDDYTCFAVDLAVQRIGSP